MGKKILATEGASKRVRDIGTGAPAVEAAAVAEALGAEVLDSAFSGQGSPTSAFQLRFELLSRLHSSGGRPALRDATRLIKVPVTENQCRDLEDLAASLADLEFAPSTGQVASVLLGLSLRLAKESPDQIRKELRPKAVSVVKHSP
jgi:hypothetical protein